MPDTVPEYDLVIVGGGINGAGIARDAALRGLRVILLEKGDFGSGTTSFSSRLIHGGLRYLEYAEINLVYESLHERAHPRGAGTFARILGYYVRERGVLSLMDGLRKMTLMPAQRLETVVPRMASKGRVQVGADADLTLFDPARVIDRATYDAPDQFSAGIRHVLVAGTFVVRDETLVDGVTPGQAIRAVDQQQ